MGSLLELVTERPLCFLDLESTGTNTSADRIVEIGLVIIHPPGNDGAPAPAPTVKTRRLNPGVAIPAEATEVHGITDADVQAEPTFKSIATALSALVDPCDFAGFNLRGFDFPMLRAEFKRCGFNLDHRTRRLIDLQYLFHHREPRHLAAAVRFYLGRDHEGGHSAHADTMVLLELLEAQMAHYDDIPCAVDALHATCDEFRPFRTEAETWFGDDLTEPVFQCGKLKGRDLGWALEYDSEYIGWMMTKAEDMDEDVKEFIRRFRRDHLMAS